MMKRNHVVFGGLIAIVIVSLFFLNGERTKASVKKEAKVAPAVPQDKVSTVAAAPQRKMFSIAPHELKRMRESLPLTEEVREEVEENPHRTPPSLLKFAKALSPLMEKGLKDEHDAAILMNALRDCALTESSAQAARVLCVTNSERLAQNHQLLKAKADDLRARVDPEVKKILERQDALKK